MTVHLTSSVRMGADPRAHRCGQLRSGVGPDQSARQRRVAAARRARRQPAGRDHDDRGSQHRSLPRRTRDLDVPRRRPRSSPARRAGSARTSCARSRRIANECDVSSATRTMRRCSRSSVRRSSPSSATFATRRRSMRCSTASDRPTVFHAAGVIHPEGQIRSLFDVNVGGTQLTLDRARRSRRAFASCTCRPTRRSVRTTRRRTGSPRTSPYNPYMAYGQSKLEAEQLVMRSYEHGDLADRDRAATVVLRAVPARPPDAVPRRRASRPVSRSSATARNSGRWCSPATSCTVCCLPRRRTRRRATRTGSPTRSRTSSVRSSTRSEPRSSPRDST